MKSIGSGSRLGSRAFSSLQAQALRFLSLGSSGSGSRLGSRAFSSLQAEALRFLSLGSSGSGSRLRLLSLKNSHEILH